MSSTDDLLLRTTVVRAAWSRLHGVEQLTGGDGAPLTRAVKRILDPLVLRTHQHPAIGRALVDAPTAAVIERRIADAAARLEATAAWFTLCKRSRRRLGITAGNAQERCFPIAFELATLHGMPADATDATSIADAAIRAAHADESVDAAAIAAILADDARAAAIEASVRGAWDAAMIAGEAWRGSAVLDDVTAVIGGRDEAWPRLVGSAAGISDALRHDGGSLLADIVEAGTGRRPAAGVAEHLGLQAGSSTMMPAIRGMTQTPLLERQLQRRAAAAARHADGVTIDGLLDDEAARIAEPFGLFTPALHAVLVLGAAAATAMRPLEGPDDAAPQSTRDLAAALEREATVLHARRLGAGALSSTPGVDDVVDDLLAFHRPLLRRLWARLHGLDQLGEAPDARAAHDLLTGVVRSTILDLRQRVRRSLERHELARRSS